MLKSSFSKAFMCVWAILCIYTLYTYLNYDQVGYNGELYIIYFAKISTLNFPLGPITLTLVEIFIVGLSKLGLNIDTGFSQHTNLFITWFVMVVAGFFQWFFLVPFLCKSFFQKFFNNEK